jgi:putative salt-induced outer membrane protein YdiY
MKTICSLAVLFAMMAVGPLGVADTVVTNNGSNLIGTVDSADGKQLMLKTDYADVITIQWSQVKAVTTDKPIFVVTPDKRTVSGTVTTEDSNLVIHSSSGDVRVPLSDAQTIRSAGQQQTYESNLHPSFVQNWTGGLNLGFALARGNSDTTNLNLGFTGDRKTQNDEAYLTSVYADNNAPGEGGVTANSILAGIRYQHNLNQKFFAFVSADYLHNELQFLDLQQIYTGGLGYHAIATPNTTFDVFAGPNYTRQSYGAGATAVGFSPGVTRNILGLTLGEAFMHKFGALTTLTEDFTFYPELTPDAGQYLFAFDAGATTQIHKWLGWNLTVSDRYVSNPPVPGTKTNDVIFATGLTVSFDTTIK